MAGVDSVYDQTKIVKGWTTSELVRGSLGAKGLLMCMGREG